MWRIVRAQHGVVAGRQLATLGFSRHAIDERLKRGRLHRVYRGVFAVGRPDLGQKGCWMAAVLACGEGAALSHASAAELWGLRTENARARQAQISREAQAPVHVSVTNGAGRGHARIVAHRRPSLNPRRTTRHHGIPVTTPAQTLIDIAVDSTPDELESAVSEADLRGVIGVAALRRELERHGGERGAGRLRELIDRRTFRRSRSWLERRFRPLARRAGYPTPLTNVIVNGFEVDFYWPRLGFVVETDGGSFHRTPFQQTRDRRRDQAHTAAGLVHLRFTHGQIHYQREHVVRMLVATKRLLPAPGARVRHG